MLEIELPKLVGPSVRFKMVVNYDRALESENNLGIAFIPSTSDKDTLKPSNT